MSVQITIEEIRESIDKYAKVIGANNSLLPTYNSSIDGGHPHIEIDKFGKMHYVVIERGSELDRRTTDDLDNLLYWVFSDVAFSLASKFELENRIESQDSRRILFSKQESLLDQIKKDWGMRERVYHQTILHTKPFDDLVSTRVSYYKELIRDGQQNELAWQMACKKYPEPA